MIIRPGILLATLGLVLAGGNGVAALASLDEVRALAPSLADAGQPVKLDATVTFLDQEGVFIHDGREGIFLRWAEMEYGPLGLKPGTRIRVEGVTTAGGFLPDLNYVHHEMLGAGPLPEPVPVTLDNLFSPSLDCQWVEVPALIVGAEGQVGPHFALAAEVFGWTLKILVPVESDTAKRAPALMQQRVRFRAVAATVFNEQRQMTGRYFLMPSLDFISRVDESMTPSDVKVLAVSDLLRSDTSTLGRVVVRGVVTGCRKGELFLRGEGGSLRVVAAGADRFKPGDRVEAEGVAAMAPFRPILRARRVSRIATGPAPAPLPLDRDPANLHLFPAELVTVEADLLGLREEPAALVLQCRADEQFFEATIGILARLPEGLMPGARVRLVGNCELLTSQPLPRSQWVDGFRLHLRGAGDLKVIQTAPWWTLERILLATSILGVVVVAVLLWNVVLRGRVRAQTQIIGSQIEREAVLHERQRIARELHDSLEQEMTGVALQLRNVRRRLQGDPQRAKEALTLAQDMIRHCRQEARTSIRDLRSVALEQGGVEGAVRDLISPVAGEAGVEFCLTVRGEARRLERRLENDLVRVAQEACSNAVQHGSPTRLEVTLDYRPDSVRLQVKDDGCGFDTSQPVTRGHFGLLGMSERAAHQHGRLSTQSHPGKGTTVTFEVPLPNNHAPSGEPPVS